MNHSRTIWVAILGVFAYLVFAFLVERQDKAFQLRSPPAALVLAAPFQVLTYGGDRYLAANVESMRAAVSGGTLRRDEADFRARAHLVVAELNPCHEDNYWVGNAELTWGGRHPEGFGLLRKAMNCRTWDPWPAFFFGFNQQFFNRDLEQARWALDLAADRADEKTAAAFRNFSVALLARNKSDAHVAAKLVRQEEEKTSSPRLKALLGQRAKRLDGLATLRDAQAKYEDRFGKPLSNPSDLVSTGVLVEYPDDPTGIGYEIKDGRFQLRRVTHEGLESLR